MAKSPEFKKGSIKICCIFAISIYNSTSAGYLKISYITHHPGEITHSSVEGSYLFQIYLIKLISSLSIPLKLFFIIIEDIHCQIFVKILSILMPLILIKIFFVQNLPAYTIDAYFNLKYTLFKINRYIFSVKLALLNS